MSKRTSKFFARTRRNLPKGLPWLFEEIEYHDGIAMCGRCICYCFDRTHARRIARALNAEKQYVPIVGPPANGLVQTTFLEAAEVYSGPVS